MKVITILSLLLLVSPAFGELTQEDLEAIRGIVKEEVTASEKRTREYIDLKIETVNARIDGLEKSVDARFKALDDRMNNLWRLMMGLFGLVAATIAVPQIIVAYRDRGRRELEKRQEDLQTEIQQLREQIESLQQ